MERVLLVVNSRAGSVSAPTREVIIKALSADFKLEAIDTAARGHASDLARQAVADGFSAVVAFGGDGTLNEAAQGVVGTDVSLGVIPGGSTNVLARSLGIPTDPVVATAYVASRLRSGSSRRINVGRLNDRYFIVAAGIGLDAEVVRRVEEHPEAKRRNSSRAFLLSALNIGFTRYRGADPQMTLEVEGFAPERVLQVVTSNGRPLTYYKRLPVDALPQAKLDGGIDVLALKKVRTLTIPRLVWSLFVSRSHVHWKNATYHHNIRRAIARADKPLAIQVDGDYIGEAQIAEFVLVPNALDLIT